MITYMMEHPVYTVEAENIDEAMAKSMKLHNDDNLNYLMIMDVAVDEVEV